MPAHRVRSTTAGLLALASTLACGRAATVGSPAPAPPSAPAARVDPPAASPGARVVRSMYDMYAGRWYRTLTFVQKTTLHPVTGTGAPIVQMWYEAAAFPGKLRIDVDDPSRGNGSLYRGDSVYAISAGRVSSARRDRNDLLILGFDVYTQPAATTEQILKERGFDLAKSYETTWQGKPTIVVGALAGDTTSKQFWVEKDRMVFTRLIMPGAQGRNDIRFNQYVRTGNGWLAVDVEFYLNGRMRMKEEYSDVRINVTLDPALFEPERWTTAKHWRSR